MKTKIGAGSAGAGAVEGGLERSVDVMSLMGEESMSGSLATSIPDPVKRQKQVSVHCLHPVEVISRMVSSEGVILLSLLICFSCLRSARLLLCICVSSVRIIPPCYTKA